MKYILETPIKGILGAQKYKTIIHWRNGILISDEPEKLGGRDLGPDPYTLLLSSLVACTLATLKMYIDQKQMDISEIEIEANIYYKIESGETVAYIDRSVRIGSPIDPETNQKLLLVAENCPISRTLKGNINISTSVIK
ncbi:OsmC family protein [Algoriphagus sp. NG3]|uniref:OsmC family protein n=1 Tax=Algoriphagus sp. NG3 TaxID=3097546 RepID=UPI002A82154B|nr:OsmC family protein [Algoriphagus sp. NG3]WPR77298.1 OsmC family protein [Algoriphagus sp. NG3]